ncbi:MAG: ornithine carbamoyltransferase [Ignavibacteriales bacterium]|nr:ornithine carbamoyltransferase [Ignavibacteriales bacterium]
MKKDFLTIAEWSSDELFALIDLSKEIKKHPENYRHSLEGKSIATIFEKQSLRTHVTFDVGIYQLGAHAIYLTQGDISLGKRESIYDTGKNLERWVDGVVVRTYAHKTCTDLAEAMKIPVINALTDFEHPCQALGDFLTVHEKKWSFTGKKFVFIGDGNNVCHSLMIFAAKVGMNFVANTPKGYEPDKNVVKLSAAAAKKMGSTIEVINDPKEAVKNADVLYTDVWTSMGQEAEKEKRLEIFKSYQVNKKLMAVAKSDAIFMHCLPAHRGEEVTDDVIDSKNSVVFDEAENRLHTQKAVMLTLLKGA